MNYDKKTLRDVNLENKIVILRSDLNVPIKDGAITNDKRIKESLATINYILEKGSKIVLLSHLGRVKSKDDLEKRTLKPVYEYLKKIMPNVSIDFEENNTNSKLADKIKKMSKSSIILLENTRFNDIDNKGKIVKKESGNDLSLAKFWGSLGDVFVNDAFGTAHRAHASNVGIAKNIKESCIGLLVEKELKMLSQAIDNPRKPVISIFGGAKISDKIDSIKKLAELSDKVLIGGGMSYTFQKALGYEIGKSLFEEQSLNVAKELLDKYRNKIVLPVDVNAAKEFVDTKPKKFKINKFDPEYEGMDIGKKTIKIFSKELKNAQTIIWNGPLGVCEFSNFEKGTLEICKIIAKVGIKNNAFTLIGGGDSAAAAIKLGFENQFSHISTGGGASIEFLEGKDLPGISSIKNKNDSKPIHTKNKTSSNKITPKSKATNKKPEIKNSKKPAPKKSSESKKASSKEIKKAKK